MTEQNIQGLLYHGVNVNEMYRKWSISANATSIQSIFLLEKRTWDTLIMPLILQDYIDL